MYTELIFYLLGISLQVGNGLNCCGCIPQNFHLTNCEGYDSERKEVTEQVQVLKEVVVVGAGG